MIDKDFITADGLEEAEDMMRFLAKLGSSTTGIALYAEGREHGLTNADVMKYLAEGGRDITPTDDDSDACARLYLARAEKVLRTLVNKTKGLTATGKKRKAGKIRKPINEIAENAQASALKVAGRKMQEILTERVSREMDNEGGGLDKVSDAYAKQRNRKYGVPESAVLKASGQLLRNLEAGKLRLSKIQGLAEMAKGFLG